MKIKNSRFAITGGNRGIGLAVAEMAAACGAHVVIVSRSVDANLKAQLLKLGAASVEIIQGDLSTFEGTEAVGRELQSLDIDILFNNAGLLTGGLIEEQSLEEIYKMFQVNINALVHLSRALIPGMVARGCGKIVNNSSVSAFMHFPCASTYAASKAAVVAFTNCIEAELQSTGVTTLCLITPGIKTRMFDEIEEKYSKNIEVPKDSISTKQYALQIQAAIESDQKVLLPKGATGIGLAIARYANPLFRTAVRSKFKRVFNSNQENKHERKNV